MSTEAATTALTSEDLLAMADDGVGRQLIRGRLLEERVTRRNPRHSRVEMTIGYLLNRWLDTQPGPRGQVVGGEAGFRLRRDPDTFVGIDVAYVPHQLAAATPRKAAYFDGPPTLAVEVLSPSDRQDDVADKVQEYLARGVAVVWVVDTDFETVRVHRPDAPPVLFNVDDELTAEPQLPGFRTPVARLFA